MVYYYFFAIVLCYITSKFPSCICETTNNVLQQTVNVDFSGYSKTNESGHVFVDYLNLAEGNVIVNIINAPNNDGFFVIQVHSFIFNVTLSKTGDSVTGTNVGLVETNLSNKPYIYYINYVNKPTTKVLLSVIVHESDDPVPGGCNMVFKNEISPYQVVLHNDNIIKVDFQPASIANRYCESKITPHLDMYHIYLPEGSFDADTYFDGIRKLLTVDDIVQNGRKVPEPIGHSLFRRYYSAYSGTGSVYGIIATFGNKTAAYVPAVTYACDILNWDIECIGPVTVGWKISCAILLFVGLFTCYFGHRFFKTQMFIFGCLFGAFVSYISASMTNTLSVGQSLGISILFGLIYGAVWIVLWWRFGSPILSVLLPVAINGYMLACIMFYSGVGDYQMFQRDMNYWLILFSVLIPTTALLLITTMFANILACSVMGATAVTFSLDHYVGGNVHYVILNNIRRATVRNFNLAILDPPFQYRDIILSVVWTFLLVTGVYTQIKQQRGRPPFPPPPIRSAVLTEITPLLYGRRNRSYL